MNLLPVSIGLTAAALIAPSSALAAPLTIRSGESWVFAIERGEPVRARRVSSSTRPSAGQIKATLVVGMGTTMTLTNNSPLSYAFRAELVGAASVAAGKPRTCALPPKGVPVLEYWPTKASAVRISTFKVTSAANCP